MDEPLDRDVHPRRGWFCFECGTLDPKSHSSNCYLVNYLAVGAGQRPVEVAGEEERKN